MADKPTGPELPDRDKPVGPELPDHDKPQVPDRPDGPGGPGQPPEEQYEIIVNGRPNKVSREEVTFDEIVGIAYPDGGRGPTIAYTVTYYTGAGDKPEGGLTEGESTKVMDGTVFNVTRTDRS